MARSRTGTVQGIINKMQVRTEEITWNVAGRDKEKKKFVNGD